MRDERGSPTYLQSTTAGSRVPSSRQAAPSCGVSSRLQVVRPRRCAAAGAPPGPAVDTGPASLRQKDEKRSDEHPCPGPVFIERHERRPLGIRRPGTASVRAVQTREKGPFRIPERAFRCSPDGIRTRATALRGRRPRPLDDGAAGHTMSGHSIWNAVFPLGYQDSNLD